MLITQADYHNGRGTQSTSAITGKSTNKSETAIISETGVKRSVLFKENTDFIWLYFYGLYCYAIKKEQTLEIEQKRKCLEMLWTDGQRRFLRETLGLFLTSYTRYRSGYSSASLKKWELHQQGRLTSQYRLENKCY